MKNALVTGAGTGTGKAVALQLAKAGLIVKIMHTYKPSVTPGEYSQSKIWTLVQK